MAWRDVMAKLDADANRWAAGRVRLSAILRDAFRDGWRAGRESWGVGPFTNRTDGGAAAEMLSRLVASFPAFEFADGARPWNAEAFAAWIAGRSDEARRGLGAFVLSVATGGRLDDALRWWTRPPYSIEPVEFGRLAWTVTAKDRAALVAWLDNPFWCD